MTFQPGTKKIDKKYDVLFKPKKHLGTGSFGRVEKCLSKVDGKTYAVKLL
jgi:serine/threonine protein kinase